MNRENDMSADRPDESGVEAAKEIAAELPGIAVVRFTGDHSVSLSADCRPM